MAKITLTKLGLTKNSEVSTFEWNGQPIEVKQYLPFEEKVALIERILNLSVDNDSKYYNVAVVYANIIIEVMLAYTNITVTDKQKEDRSKLYDLFVSSGLSGEVIGNQMNPTEYAQIKTWVTEMIHSVYEYNNSVYGILDTISADYSNLNLEADTIKDKIANPENLTLLKDVLTKLG